MLLSYRWGGVLCTKQPKLILYPPLSTTPEGQMLNDEGGLLNLLILSYAITYSLLYDRSTG